LGPEVLSLIKDKQWDNLYHYFGGELRRLFSLENSGTGDENPGSRDNKAFLKLPKKQRPVCSKTVVGFLATLVLYLHRFDVNSPHRVTSLFFRFREKFLNYMKFESQVDESKFIEVADFLLNMKCLLPLKTNRGVFLMVASMVYGDGIYRQGGGKSGKTTLIFFKILSFLEDPSCESIGQSTDRKRARQDSSDEPRTSSNTESDGSQSVVSHLDSFTLDMHGDMSFFDNYSQE
jgi:hypothetical protein